MKHTRTLPIQSRKKRGAGAKKGSKKKRQRKSAESADADGNHSTMSASSDESVGMGALLDAVALVEDKPEKESSVEQKSAQEEKEPEDKKEVEEEKETEDKEGAEDKKPAAAVSDEEEQRMLGINALIQVATNIETPGSKKGKKTGRKEDRPKTRASSQPRANKGTLKEQEDGLELAEVRPRGSLPGDEIFYPSEEELKEATTRRSRTALFSWYDRLRDLYTYKEQYGDCMVPQKYPANHAMGIWVNKQRMEKRLRDQGLKSTMTDHRLGLLDKVGFHWAKHKGQVSWDQKYEELMEFQRIHGHCNVPTKFRDNSALGRWISTQRAQMKEWRRGVKTSMTKERYAKLCALDFQFERLKSNKKGESGEGSTEESSQCAGSKAPTAGVPAPPSAASVASKRSLSPPTSEVPAHSGSMAQPLAGPYHNMSAPSLSQFLPHPPPGMPMPTHQFRFPTYYQPQYEPMPPLQDHSPDLPEREPTPPVPANTEYYIQQQQASNIHQV